MQAKIQGGYLYGTDIAIKPKNEKMGSSTLDSTKMECLTGSNICANNVKITAYQGRVVGGTFTGCALHIVSYGNANLVDVEFYYKENIIANYIVYSKLYMDSIASASVIRNCEIACSSIVSWVMRNCRIEGSTIAGRKDQFEKINISTSDNYIKQSKIMLVNKGDHLRDTFESCRIDTTNIMEDLVVYTSCIFNDCAFGETFSIAMFKKLKSNNTFKGVVEIYESVGGDYTLERIIPPLDCTIRYMLNNDGSGVKRIILPTTSENNMCLYNQLDNIVDYEGYVGVLVTQKTIFASPEGNMATTLYEVTKLNVVFG